MYGPDSGGNFGGQNTAVVNNGSAAVVIKFIDFTDAPAAASAGTACNGNIIDVLDLTPAEASRWTYACAGTGI